MQSFPGRPRCHVSLRIRVQKMHFSKRNKKMTKRELRKLREVLEARQELKESLNRGFFI